MPVDKQSALWDIARYKEQSTDNPGGSCVCPRCIHTGERQLRSACAAVNRYPPMKRSAGIAAIIINSRFRRICPGGHPRHRGRLPMVRTSLQRASGGSLYNSNPFPVPLLNHNRSHQARPILITFMLRLNRQTPAACRGNPGNSGRQDNRASNSGREISMVRLVQAVNLLHRTRTICMACLARTQHIPGHLHRLRNRDFTALLRNFRRQCRELFKRMATSREALISHQHRNASRRSG